MNGNPISQIKYDNGVESICLRKRGASWKSPGCPIQSGSFRTHGMVSFLPPVEHYMNSVLYLCLKMDGQLFKPSVFNYLGLHHQIFKQSQTLFIGLQKTSFYCYFSLIIFQMTQPVKENRTLKFHTVSPQMIAKSNRCCCQQFCTLNLFVQTKERRETQILSFSIYKEELLSL